jgi:hypothetical protein
MFKPKQKTVISRTCPDFKRCIFNKHVCKKTAKCANATEHYHYHIVLGLTESSSYAGLCLGVGLESIEFLTNKGRKFIDSGELRANDGILILPYKKNWKRTFSNTKED